MKLNLYHQNVCSAVNEKALNTKHGGLHQKGPGKTPNSDLVIEILTGFILLQHLLGFFCLFALSSS